MGNQKIIVIGASAGGVETITEVLAALPADLSAPVLVVQHTGPDSPGLLASVFGRKSRIRVKYAEHGEAVHNGSAYVAPVDRHLLVRDGRLILGGGPRENRSRPAIDPLFRSAAAAYDSGAVGVVLTGMLDDGAAGLAAIKRCGGIACVQDPGDALFPDMPRNAMEGTDVDHVLPAGEIGGLLARLSREPALRAFPVPEDVLLEVRIAEAGSSAVETTEHMGPSSPFVCPECGGGLRELHNDPVQRFRCNTGHSYTIRTLIADQGAVIERALWAAVRALEEKASMLKRLTHSMKEKGSAASSVAFEREGGEARKNAEQLRALLLSVVTQPSRE